MYFNEQYISPYTATHSHSHKRIIKSCNKVIKLNLNFKKRKEKRQNQYIVVTQISFTIISAQDIKSLFRVPRDGGSPYIVLSAIILLACRSLKIFICFVVLIKSFGYIPSIEIFNLP